MTTHRLKHFLERNDGGCWGDDPTGIDDTVVLRSTEQSANGDWRITDPAVRHVSASERKSKTIDLDDIIITKSSGSADHIGKASIADQSVAELEAVYSNFMQRIRVNQHASPRYVWHLLNSSFARYHYNVYATSTSGLGNLNGTIVGNLPFPVPDLATQRQVADFLDRETARADLLIEKKQRLVALWRERVDAEVSRIVLQTDRSESDRFETGVDWLGRIPRSWQLSRVGWELQRITYGFTNPMPTEEEGPFLLTANDVNYGRILWESARHTSQNAFDHDLTDKSRPRKGDVLLTKDGTLGRVAIHDGRPACINQSVALLRPRKNRLTSEFLANVLLSRRYQNRMVFEAGGTTIKHIYITRLQKMPLPVPSMGEQREINAKIEATRQRVLVLGEKINASIDGLKEYRSALITAAVTGKIDVSTHAKSGTPDRHLEAIQEEMEA